MAPKVLVQLCLAPETIDSRLFVSLVRDHELGFVPERIHCNRFGHAGRRFGPAALEEVERTPSRYAEVEGPGDQSFALAGISGHELDQLIWSVESLPGHLGLLDSVLAIPEFTSGHLTDAADMHWQSETSIESYERVGRPHAHLPKVAGGFWPGEDVVIDVSGNPGRATAVGGMWLHAAARMWFGERASRYLELDRLASCPVGAVSEPVPGVVQVDLFPLEWHQTDLEAVRERQAAFRAWMGYDELEARADEIDTAESDPEIEIDTGTFPRGGVRRITEWLDERGSDPAPRSRARRRRVTELSPTGETLHVQEDTV